MSETDRISDEIATLNRKLEMFQTDKGKATSQTFVEQACGICDTIGHTTADCTLIPIVKNVDGHEQTGSSWGLL